MEPTNPIKRALIVIGMFAPLCMHAAVYFQPISMPDSGYLSGTTKIPVASYLPPLSDSTLTISFSVGGNYFPPIYATTFASWSSPPYSESSDPGTVYYYFGASIPGRSLYLNFSKPLQTFGVEMEVELWNTTSPITATFFNGATPVGSITQTIGGWQGARLFAAHTDTTYFDRVVIYDPSSPSGIGIGQFRYAVVPEPSMVSLLVLGFAGLRVCRTRFR
jgi:hypothetical protein